MLLSFKVFGGIAPKLDPRRLPDTGAQYATNTKLWRGRLESFRNPSDVATAALTKSAAKTIYRWGQALGENAFWLSWTTDVNVAKGFIADDTTERTYWTGDGVPKKSDSSVITSGVDYPAFAWELKVPAPVNKASFTGQATNHTLALADSIAVMSSSAGVSGTSPNFTGVFKDVLEAQGSENAKVDGTAYSGVQLEERVYVYTYVTAWGEESKPSPASAVASVDPAVAQTVTMDSGPSPNNANVTLKRLYRSSVGDQGTAYQFVTELPVATASYTDSKKQTELGEPLPSLYWDTPPDDMAGLCTMASGIMAAFSKNNVCFSEAYRPHAWPQGNRHALDYNVVACAAFTSYLVVGTQGFPYLFQGSDPGSMIPQKLEAKQACVSKRSMVSTGDGVVYASPDGLIFVGPQGVRNLLDEIMTRDDWQAYVPETIEGYFFEGRYYNFGPHPFCMDIPAGAFYNLSVGVPVEQVLYPAAYQDIKRDALYVLDAAGTGRSLRKWDVGPSLMSYGWKSKKFVLPAPANFSVAQVEAQSYPVNFSLIVDGVQQFFGVIGDANPFRLPGGYMGKECEILVAGSAVVNAVYVATSVAELKTV